MGLDIRFGMRGVVALGAVAACVLVLASSAQAITPTVTDFTQGLNMNEDLDGGIAAGPDGNLWFADFGATKAIGRITPSGTITEFSAGLNSNSFPEQTAAGPDGNVWFSDDGNTPAIGRITPGGTITEFDLPAGSAPADGITAGPDGNLWFVDVGTTKAVGEINPTTHAINEFSMGLNVGSHPDQIAAGPDGNLWFTDEGTTKAIGEINPTTHTINEFSVGLNAGSRPFGIATGPDGNVWFTDDGTTSAVGEINPATHAITEFSSGLTANDSLQAIGAGPDGALWFGDESSPTPSFGRITTAGAITKFDAHGTLIPQFVAAGADGNMWFTEGSAIGRITTPPAAVTSAATATGQTTATVSGAANGHAQATSFHVEYGPVGGTSAQTAEQSLGTTTSDTPVSVTLSGLTPGTAYQARVVVTNPTGTTAGAFISFTTSSNGPRLTGVEQSHRRWREGKSLPQIAAARRPPVGTTFRFTLNEAARMQFVFEQRLPGRKVKGRCVAPTSKNRAKPSCARLVRRGTLSFTAKAGGNKLRFQGRLSKHKKLPIGRYELVIRATTTAGQVVTATLTFTIVSG